MKLYLVLLLVLCVLLVSCGQTSERGTDINYKQGFTDLTISYHGTAEEYQDQRLTLPISVHNTLAYDITDAEVLVQGFDTHYVELYSDKQHLGDLEGKSIFNNDGMQEDVMFEGMVKRLLPGAVSEPQNFRTYVSYNSKVEFSPSICVSSQQGSYVGAAYGTDQGACTFQKEISYNGQGAPLGVTALEIIPRQGKQIELRMTIENKGKGKVGRVTLASAAIGGKTLTCEFRGDMIENSFLFKSEEKSATLVCAGYLTSDATYTTPLFVELWYDYEINQKEMLTILE